MIFKKKFQIFKKKNLQSPRTRRTIFKSLTGNKIVEMVSTKNLLFFEEHEEHYLNLQLETSFLEDQTPKMLLLLQKK